MFIGSLLQQQLIYITAVNPAIQLNLHYSSFIALHTNSSKMHITFFLVLYRSVFVITTLIAPVSMVTKLVVHVPCHRPHSNCILQPEAAEVALQILGQVEASGLTLARRSVLFAEGRDLHGVGVDLTYDVEGRHP